VLLTEPLQLRVGTTEDDVLGVGVRDALSGQLPLQVRVLECVRVGNTVCETESLCVGVA